MSESTNQATPESVTEQREAPKAARQAKRQELADLRGQLREAEATLKQLKAAPLESNELLNHLLAEVDHAVARYAHRIKGEANRPGRRLTLADMNLGGTDAQCFFGATRVREGLRRLFPSGNGGVTEADRTRRIHQAEAEIITLTAAISRMGG